MPELDGLVLIIDDDAAFSQMLATRLEFEGVATAHEANLQDGLRRVRSWSPDVVFLDVNMPDGNGLAAIPSVRSAPSAPEVIIITGQGDGNGAEHAIRSGAWDYVQKGRSLHDYALSLRQALKYRLERRDSRGARRLVLNHIIGNSATLQKRLDIVRQASSSEASVLITGETGTGKELFARAIHENSARAGRPFVVVDCAALPESIVESTLFGHVRGAFTGATESRAGLIKVADGGTLFLDEVAEMPLELQKAFLRVLQERRFRPVGSRTEVHSDFRVIAATNRDPLAMIEDGTFRKDLYYRLCALTIDLPALRERTEDIEALASFHLNRLQERVGGAPQRVAPDCLDVLQRYGWPGNVRELVNVLEASLAAAVGFDTLYSSHLPVHVRASAAKAGADAQSPAVSRTEVSSREAVELPSLRDARVAATERAERAYLEELLGATDGDLLRARKIAKVSRSHFYALLKKHDLGDR